MSILAPLTGSLVLHLLHIHVSSSGEDSPTTADVFLLRYAKEEFVKSAPENTLLQKKKNPKAKLHALRTFYSQNKKRNSRRNYFALSSKSYVSWLAIISWTWFDNHWRNYSRFSDVDLWVINALSQVKFTSVPVTQHAEWLSFDRHIESFSVMHMDGWCLCGRAALSYLLRISMLPRHYTFQICALFPPCCQYILWLYSHSVHSLKSHVQFFFLHPSPYVTAFAHYCKPRFEKDLDPVVQTGMSTVVSLFLATVSNISWD